MAPRNPGRELCDYGRYHNILSVVRRLPCLMSQIESDRFIGSTRSIINRMKNHVLDYLPPPNPIPPPPSARHYYIIPFIIHSLLYTIMYINVFIIVFDTWWLPRRFKNISQLTYCSRIHGYHLQWVALGFISGPVSCGKVFAAEIIDESEYLHSNLTIRISLF